MKSVVRFALYSLIFLVTLEGLARLDDWVSEGAPLTGNHDIETIFISQPGSKVGKPGAQFGKWQINSLGFRGPELEAGRIPIAVYGASETFGIYESEGKEYPRQLESRLNQGASKGYNVVNLAVPGLRIGRTGYLDESLKKVKPKYVVVYPTPAAYIGVSQGFCEGARQAGSSQAPSQVAALPQPHRSRLAGKVDTVIKQAAPIWLMTSLKEIGLWRATRNLDVKERVDEAAIQAYEADLRCVMDTIRAHGARPVMVTHATMFGEAVTPETQHMLVAWRRFYPDLAEGGFLDLERRANAVVRRLASSSPDAVLVEADKLVPGGPANFADFVHFTDAGAGLLAAGLAQAIRAQEASAP